VFWSAVAGSTVTAVGVYAAFLASLPDCGPSGNTTLGRIYSVVPLVIVLAEMITITLMGRRTHRSAGAVLVALVVAVIATLIFGALVFLLFYTAGDCGE